MIAASDKKIEEELGKLVRVLGNVVPSLAEVRVFGSYNNGNWNPEISDVDVFVETRDEDYSRNPENYERRAAVISYIKREIDGKIPFDVIIFSTEDVKRYSQSDGLAGVFIYSAKNGRPLHLNELPILN